MTENHDRDSKAALRIRCPSCGRRVAEHPFCAKCGEPQLCGQSSEKHCTQPAAGAAG